MTLLFYPHKAVPNKKSPRNVINAWQLQWAFLERNSEQQASLRGFVAALGLDKHNIIGAEGPTLLIFLGGLSGLDNSQGLTEEEGKPTDCTKFWVLENKVG